MDKCPKCGAEYDSDDYFKCGSRKTWGPFVMGLNQSEKCRIRELEAEVQRLRPRWTDSPPTVPGWYWWRDEEHMPRIYEVWEYSGYGSLCIGGGHMVRRVDTLRGQWAGPIPQPEDGNE